MNIITPAPRGRGSLQRDDQMKTVETSFVYENPLPQLRAVNSAFPFLCQLPDGKILASHQMGQAFESVDGTSFLSESTDGGKTWSKPRQMFDKSGETVPLNDNCKLTMLPDGRIAALGYQFFREDPELPLGNPRTGGLLSDEIFFSISEDGGQTWAPRKAVDCAWGNHVEASAPLTVLQDGSWAAPITGFAKWDGTPAGRNCGRLLRTFDSGETWNDDAVCMEFPGDTVTCFEQRMCQLEDGTLVVIGWNEDMVTGKRLHNHITLSHDNGKTFCAPIDTGIGGQASFVMALEGTKVLTLHALRRDTDVPGIYGYIADVAGCKWRLLESKCLWHPNVPIVQNTKMAEIFSFLKFGQPGAIRLQDGDILMSHWICEEGVYKTCATRISL